ncbi:MAG: hypothetical protein ACJAZ2_001001 [Glaciecola sp.]|jgi:hypothetical protein
MKDFKLLTLFYYFPAWLLRKPLSMLKDRFYFVVVVKGSFWVDNYISLLLVSSVRMDSKPPSSIGEYDWDFRTGIGVTR